MKRSAVGGTTYGIEEKLLQLVSRQVVTRDIVEGVGAGLGLAQLHAQWRCLAEGDYGPQGDVTLGLWPADLCLRDHQRFGGEQLLEVRDRLRDVRVLCRRCGDQRQQRRNGDQAHQAA
jgi:hypothetical protein